jgi:hypothetical protein
MLQQLFAPLERVYSLEYGFPRRVETYRINITIPEETREGGTRI